MRGLVHSLVLEAHEDLAALGEQLVAVTRPVDGLLYEHVAAQQPLVHCPSCRCGVAAAPDECTFLQVVSQKGCPGLHDHRVGEFREHGLQLLGLPDHRAARDGDAERRSELVGLDLVAGDIQGVIRGDGETRQRLEARPVALERYHGRVVGGDHEVESLALE